ncbi:MAG: RNA polymerase II transcription factor B 52 kDa subunit [Chaenotheca gracillima]|nr:MAG: RNA polymerase II transcription factor B 52 kDa subunit [Chaenotheca gracillima]
MAPRSRNACTPPSPSPLPATSQRKPRKLSSLSSFSSLASIGQVFSHRRSATNHPQLSASTSTSAIPRVRRKTFGSSANLASSGSEKDLDHRLLESQDGQQHRGLAQSQTRRPAPDSNGESQKRKPHNKDFATTTGSTNVPKARGTKKRWSMLSSSASTSSIAEGAELERSAETCTEEPELPQRRLLGPLGPPTLAKSRTTGVLGAPERRAGSRVFSAGSRAGNVGSKVPLPELTTNIKTHQPLSYWCGRFAALNDRFRSSDLSLAIKDLPVCDESSDEDDGSDNGALNEARVSQRTNGKEAVKHQTKKLNHDEIRVRRVFIHLYSLCSTEEARISLKAFQQQYLQREGKGPTSKEARLGGRSNLFGRMMGRKISNQTR